MIYRYPEEVHEFVRTHCREMRDADLAEACNMACGTAFTTMKAFRGNHSYKSGLPKNLSREEKERLHPRWPEGFEIFIRENAPGITNKELLEKANNHFGLSLTLGQIKAYKSNHKISSGLTGWFRRGNSPGNKGRKQSEYCTPEKLERSKRTQFKKGDRPMNELPVGTVTVRKHNGVPQRFIKVQAEGGIWDRWMSYVRYVWEKHYGPIPPGMCILHKDGDTLNDDIDNLMLASRNEIARLAKKQMFSKNPDLTISAINMIRLENTIKERRKSKE